MGETTNRGLPYPETSDTADVPRDIRALAEALDSDAVIDSGLLANRPAPGERGTFYWATDVNGTTGMLFFDNGTAWKEIGPGSLADNSVTTAKLANGAVTPTKASGPLGMMRVGFLTITSQTGVLNITGLPFRPKLVRFSYVQNFNDDSSAAQGSGAADDQGNRWAMWAITDGSAAKHRSHQSRCIYAVGADGTVQMSVDFNGMLADGFSINIIQNNNSYLVGWEAYG